MTPNVQTWDPHTDEYKNQEYSMMNYNGNVKMNKTVSKAEVK